MSLHYVVPGWLAHAQYVREDTLPETQHITGLHQSNYIQSSLLLELPQSSLEQSLSQLNVSSRWYPDTREGPHVSGPPGDQHLTVSALQDHHHANIHPALAGLGWQETSLTWAQAGNRTEGRVAQQAAGGGGGGGGRGGRGGVFA